MIESQIHFFARIKNVVVAFIYLNAHLEQLVRVCVHAERSGTITTNNNNYYGSNVTKNIIISTTAN